MMTRTLRSLTLLSLVSALLLGTVSCAGFGSNSSGKPVALPEGPQKTYLGSGELQHGKASWYSVRTNGGKRTASGEPLHNDKPTAAHRTLPMGTLVKVTNLHNGATETVRITDRGPYIRGRVIDVTIGTAKRLDMVNAGVVPVTVEPLVLSQ